MKTWIKFGIVLLVVGGGVVAVSYPVRQWWKRRNLPQWREEAVARGDIVFVVNSTGTVKPEMSVQVGAFVSGPIDPETSPRIEFNQEVVEGEVLARIDTRIYDADVKLDDVC